MSENIAPERLELPLPPSFSPTCKDNRDVEMDYKPKEENISAETGEEYNGLEEIQNVDMIDRTISRDPN